MVGITTDGKFDAFISYNRKDVEFARAICCLFHRASPGTS